MQPGDYTLGRYTVYAEQRIFVGVLWRGGLKQKLHFYNSGRHIFGTFGDKAIIAIQHHEVPYRLSNDPKRVTLNDLEMPFYVKIYCLNRFDWTRLHGFGRQLYVIQ